MLNQLLTGENILRHINILFTEISSLCKWPGWPADNQPVVSTASPGQCATGLGFVDYGLGESAGFMDTWRWHQAFGIFHVTSQHFDNLWVISAYICRCPQISENARRYQKMHTQMSEHTCRYRKMPPISENAC